MKPGAADDADNPFWAFSLALYGRPPAAAACLELQDRRGLDVNLLLFCCWAGHCGRRLQAGELQALQAAAGDWQARVVRPLRGVRRWLKGRTAALPPGAARLRRAVKAQELEAERLQQAMLHSALPLAADEGGPALAAANLLAYLGERGVTADSDDLAALAALLTSAHPELPPLAALQLLQSS